MADRSKTPVRRAQLVAPFGVGAMMTNQNGISMMCAALDDWFDEEESDDLQISTFEIEEWRLQERLGVHHFRVPPDYRRRGERNTFVNVPAVRFPQWHFCPECDEMREVPMTTRDDVRCRSCEKNGHRIEMYQVRFISICEDGHIQDFPWMAWIHRSSEPSCHGPLIMNARGGSSLSSIVVKCSSCQESRSLEGITMSDPDGANTFLSRSVQSGSTYLCRGSKPWAGIGTSEECDKPIRGSLRNASNVYFADVRSSLYVPRSESNKLEDLVVELGLPKYSPIRSLYDGPGSNSDLVSMMRLSMAQLTKSYSDDQLNAVIEIVCNPSGHGPSRESTIRTDSRETAYRRAEYDVLSTKGDGERLFVRDPGMSNYDESIRAHFNQIMLIERLRETRALIGFSRIHASSTIDEDYGSKRAVLWRNPPRPGSKQDWLPAITVHGEGIFLKLKEDRLQEWEARAEVRSLFDRMYSNFENSRHFEENKLPGPRFVLLHTFSHLLINQLVFQCGYSTAALRERLYVSCDADAPMAGILIYTAAGDADGTLGGLVRMGKPGNLESVISTALTDALWCSADPICMEAANSGGQGPDSCNLASCHNCGLLPETACEEYNRFLDRGHVIGVNGDTDTSYFREMLSQSLVD